MVGLGISRYSWTKKNHWLINYYRFNPVSHGDFGGANRGVPEFSQATSEFASHGPTLRSSLNRSGSARADHSRKPKLNVAFDIAGKHTTVASFGGYSSSKINS